MVRRSGGELSDRLANPPKIYIYEELYINAFYDLIDSVNWPNIVAYGNYHSLDKETIDDLLVILPRLQLAYNEIRKKRNGGNGQ